MVDVSSVRKAVGLLEVVGPGGWRDEKSLNVNKIVGQCTWALYVYGKGYTYISQSLWCSASKYRSRATIVLLKSSACSFHSGWYAVVFSCFVSKTAQSDSKHLLINCVRCQLKCTWRFHTKLPSYPGIMKQMTKQWFQTSVQLSCPS